MKPRTGDGPLEVTKEGRGIVMRVPLEGGGRLVVELSADEAAQPRRCAQVRHWLSLADRYPAAAIPAPAGASLAAHLPTAPWPARPTTWRGHRGRGPGRRTPRRGLDSVLSAARRPTCSPAATLTGKAGEVTPVAMRAGAGPQPRLAVRRGGRLSPPARPARRRAPPWAGLRHRRRGMLAAAVLGLPAAAVRAFAEGMLLGSYRFSLAAPAPAPATGRAEARLLVAGRTTRPAAEAVTGGPQASPGRWRWPATWRTRRRRPRPRPGWPPRPAGSRRPAG